MPSPPVLRSSSTAVLSSSVSWTGTKSSAALPSSENCGGEVPSATPGTSASAPARSSMKLRSAPVRPPSFTNTTTAGSALDSVNFSCRSATRVDGELAGR